MRLRARLPLTLSALCFVLPARAEVIALEEIIVAATRAPIGSTRVGVSASALTEADLRASGSPTVGGALSRLPGVSLTSSGPIGNTATLRIRGADARYIATYVDGIRVDDPTGVNVTTNFGLLLTGGAGRVELLRGSQSALWGGSAVGGVISVTSPQAEEGTVQEGEVEGGSYGTFTARYRFSQKTDRMETVMTALHTRSDGFSAASVGTEPDGYEITRLGLTTRYRATETVTLGFAAFGQKARQDYDGFGGAAPIDAANVQRRREAGARVFAEIETGRTLHEVEASVYAVTREYTQGATINSFDGTRLGVAWRARTVFAPGFTLQYGLDYTEEGARYANIPGGSATTALFGGFVQALWSPTDRIDVAATARIDSNSTFGTFPSGRLALAWRPDDATVVRAAVATGFRTPSIDERFGNYGTFVGNPALQPERSLSYELGAERSFAGGARLGATAFHLAIDNLVTYRFGAPATLVNVPGQSRRTGVEVSGALPLGDRVTLSGAYTYTDAVQANGNRIALVPRHDVTVALDAAVTDRLRASVIGKHQADRAVGFGAPARDYTVVNAQLTYDLGNRAEAWLRVENLFDAIYETEPGYGTSRRAVHVGLRARF